MNKKELYKTIGLIDDDLITEAENSVKLVKHLKISKIAAVAAAAVMLLSLSVWSANVLITSRGAQSSNIPTYNSVPTAETLQDDIGISPKILNNFSNGYTFDSGYIVENEDYSEDGRIFESYKSLNCHYKRNEDMISLDIDKSTAGNQSNHSDTAETYKGSDIKYFAYTNKLVPGDYQLTEQDKKDEKSGKYIFSYGSAEIKISDVQILSFEYNGLNYSICAADSELTKDELINMAKEIIDAQE